ncbi:MAG: terpene synthase family protein [Crocinitomicaceae bacterium]
MTFYSSNLTISNTDVYVHTAAGEISEKAKNISKELDIIDTNLYQGHSTMTNYVYIDAPIEKMVNVLVNYDVFYFLDDFFGEDTNTGQFPNLGKLFKIWNGEETHESNQTKVDRLYRSISYVSQALREDSPSSFFKRYTRSVIEHLDFSLSKKHYSSVDEYISIRLRTGGMFLLIDLIEYVHSIYLSPEIRNNESLSIQELQEQCALIGALSNDLFSYAKEKHSDYNLVNAYLVTHEAKSYPEAVIKSIQRVNDIYSDFQSTMERAKANIARLSKDEQKIVSKYFEALEVIVASSYHWQKVTNRYYHPENVFEDMKFKDEVST